MENNESGWRGCKKVRMIWHGEWSDPELCFTYEKKGEYSFLVFANYWTVEDAIWNDYLSCGGDKNDDDAFDKYVQEHEDGVMDYIWSYKTRTEHIDN